MNKDIYNNNISNALVYSQQSTKRVFAHRHLGIVLIQVSNVKVDIRFDWCIELKCVLCQTYEGNYKTKFAHDEYSFIPNIYKDVEIQLWYYYMCDVIRFRYINTFNICFCIITVYTSSISVHSHRIHFEKYKIVFEPHVYMSVRKIINRIQIREMMVVHVSRILRCIVKIFST